MASPVALHFSGAHRARRELALRVAGIIGRQGSGKTHLVVRLVHEFRRRGYRVSTIKHTHHHLPELDTPGKDSYRHREAGAQEVIVASDHGWALIRQAQEPRSLDALLAELAPVDIVLVEGYKQLDSLVRLEVFRAAESSEPLAAADTGIAAIACPTTLRLPTSVRSPRVDLDDTAAVADLILSLTTNVASRTVSV